MTGGASAAPVETKGGAAGYVRGAGGTRGPGSKAVTTCDASFWGSSYAVQSVTRYAAKRAGADHPGFQPQRPKGADGSIDTGLNPPEGWLHPLHITVFRHVIDDARLNGDLEWAEYFLMRILFALDAWEGKSPTAGSAPSKTCAAVRWRICSCSSTTCRVSVQFDGEGLLRNATQLFAVWLTNANTPRRTMTSSFDVFDPNDVVGLAAGYFGDKMAGGLVDLDNPAAKDVSGSGPWKLQMPVSRGRRLQIVLPTLH